MIHDEAFRNLTSTEKLYFWEVISEFNMSGGEFYKSDIWFAATLNLSLEKIRKARAKLAKMEYISMIPGTQDKRGRKLATTYKGVKWADVPEGEQFSKMDRTTFNTMVSYIGSKFTHDDVACFVYIAHMIWTKGGVFASMTKSEFVGVTGIPKSVNCAWNLVKNFEFQGGDRLFGFNDRYRSVEFKKINTVLYTPERIARIENDIEQRIDVLRLKSEKKVRDKLRQEGHVFSEDLYPLYERLYKEKHNNTPDYSWKEKELIALGEPAEVATALRIYFDSGLPSNRKTYTLASFIQGYKKYTDK